MLNSFLILTHLNSNIKNNLLPNEYMRFLYNKLGLKILNTYILPQPKPLYLKILQLMLVASLQQNANVQTLHFTQNRRSILY